METKKNKQYDLEPERPLFFGIGMIVSLSLTLLAFEWRSPIDPLVYPQPEEEEVWFMMEEPTITKHEVPKIPQPKVEKQVVSAATEFKEVEELIEELEDEHVIDLEDGIEEAISAGEIKPEEPKLPFIVVEDMPVFPRGDAALLSFIAKNIRYPNTAKRIGVEGKVYAKFVIEKDGSIGDIEIIKGIGAGCDEEAKRVLALLPKFEPGKQRGVPVRVQMQVPINFKLQ